MPEDRYNIVDDNTFTYAPQVTATAPGIFRSEVDVKVGDGRVELNGRIWRIPNFATTVYTGVNAAGSGNNRGVMYNYSLGTRARGQSSQDLYLVNSGSGDYRIRAVCETDDFYFALDQNASSGNPRDAQVSLLKIRKSDRSIRNTVSLGTNRWGIATDGTYVYIGVVSGGDDYIEVRTVSELSVQDDKEISVTDFGIPCDSASNNNNGIRGLDIQNNLLYIGLNSPHSNDRKIYILDITNIASYDIDSSSTYRYISRVEGREFIRENADIGDMYVTGNWLFINGQWNPGGFSSNDRSIWMYRLDNQKVVYKIPAPNQAPGILVNLPKNKVELTIPFPEGLLPNTPLYSDDRDLIGFGKSITGSPVPRYNTINVRNRGEGNIGFQTDFDGEPLYGVELQYQATLQPSGSYSIAQEGVTFHATYNL